MFTTVRISCAKMIKVVSKIINHICTRMSKLQSDILHVIEKPLYIMEADVLKGGASAAGDLDLFISYEVIDDA